MEVRGQLHAPAALPRGKVPGTHLLGGWVGLRAGFGRGGEEKIPALQEIESQLSRP